MHLTSRTFSRQRPNAAERTSNAGRRNEWPAGAINMRMMKVVHVITGLETGGAELFLYRLLRRTPANVESEVVSLTTIHPVGDLIKNLGIPVSALRMRRGVPDPDGIYRLARLIGRSKPNLVQTWMYHSDLLGGIAAALTNIPCIWNLRIAHRHGGIYFRPAVMMVVRTCALLSRCFPRAIICCSETVKESHRCLGYDGTKLITIPNGVDTAEFYPSNEDRMKVRQELGVGNAPIVGMIGRFHPQKNHQAFFEMARAIHAQYPDVRFLLAGSGTSPGNDGVASVVKRAGLEQAFHLLGNRSDMRQVLNAIDIVVSPSSDEGFPNAIAEAMAVGRPCVATDVGDSARLVADTGTVVPFGDTAALIAAATRMLDLSGDERDRLGAKARERISQEYSAQNTVQAYYDLYERYMKP